jgi:hypothetical protein
MNLKVERRFLQEPGREDEDGGGDPQLTRRDCGTRIPITPGVGGDATGQQAARKVMGNIPGQEYQYDFN